MSEECFKGGSSKICGCFKDASRVFHLKIERCFKQLRGFSRDPFGRVREFKGI